MKQKNYDLRLKQAPLILTITNCLYKLMFILPVIVLFFQSKGASIGDFFLIQGIFAFAVFLLEIPTGYLGDLFSRKKIIIFSYIIYLLGHIIWIIFDGFWGILGGELLFALTAALYSGTGEAYLYDCLKQQKKDKEIVKYHGRMLAISGYGIAIATLFGGFIYNQFGATVTLSLTMIGTCISIILSFLLPELKGVKRDLNKEDSKFKDLLSIIKFAINHKEIKWLMIFPALFGSGTLVLFWSMQPLMELALIPISLFGVFGFINQGSRAFTAHIANKLFRKLKTKLFCISLLSSLIIGFITAIALTQIETFYIAAILLIILGLAASSFMGIDLVSKSMVNHRVKSSERATVLSIQSMMVKFMGAIIMFSLKILVDGFNMVTMLTIMGCIIIILIFFTMKKLIKLDL